MCRNRLQVTLLSFVFSIYKTILLLLAFYGCKSDKEVKSPDRENLRLCLWCKIGHYYRMIVLLFLLLMNVKWIKIITNRLNNQLKVLFNLGNNLL